MTGNPPNPLLTGPSPSDEPRPGPVVRRTLRSTVIELLVGTAVAAVVSLVLQFAITRVTIIEPSNAPEALAAVAGALVLLVLFALVTFGRRHRPRWLRLSGIWVALSTFVTFVLAIPLLSTRFYYGGSAVDNGFRMQYMTRMAENIGLVDMNYADVAPYYPAGWFWLGGRFANLLGWPGWAAYKPYALLWVAVTAVIAFTLWSIVVRRRLALLAALVTALAGMMHGIEEPYAWPSAAWLPPIAVLCWHLLRQRSHVPRWVIGLIGVYVGFAAMTYTLHFGFAVLMIVAMAGVVGTLQVRAGERVRPVLWRLFLRLVPIGVLSLVLALVVWTPYLLATNFLLDSPRSAAQHYLPHSGAFLPTPLSENVVLSVLGLAGLVWLLLRCRRSEIAAAMLTLVLAVYVWFVLSALALIAETTLLAFRLNVILESTLAIAGVFAALEFIGWLRRNMDAGRGPQLTRVSFALGMLGAVALMQSAIGTALASTTKQAYADYYPDGTNAMRGHSPSQPGASANAINRAVERMTGRHGQQNLALTTDYTIMSFLPYWGFQQETPHYANPLADYDGRAAEINNWSNARNSPELLAMLRDSDFRTPNVFVLRLPPDQRPSTSEEDDQTELPDVPPEHAGDLSLELKEDAFPQDPNVRDYDVYFDPEVFNSPEFEHRDVGQYRVIVRR